MIPSIPNFFAVPRAATRVAALAALACAVPACTASDAERSDRSASVASDSASTQGAGSAAPVDLWIRGGTVVDGTGAEARSADVLVSAGRIVHVGPIGQPDKIEAVRTFDATGLIVAPGFIDAHAHGDPAAEPRFANFLAMGVTTIVLGQDGGGPRVSDLPAAMDSIDAAGPDVNVAFLVGHNTIRREAEVGYDDPGSEGLLRMSDLVARGLNAGAFGLSTGLEYDPGSRADVRELVAIARPVARVDAVVSSHLRSEDADRIEETLGELIEQGRRSGARVHASHLKIVLESDTARATAVLDMLEAARDDGVEASADVYPYTASFTGIGILFPDWAKEPNDYETVLSERRAELAAHLRARVESRNGPEATLFGTTDLAGKTLADVAAERGVPYEDVLINIGPGGASAAYFVMDEQVMSRLLTAPGVAVSSDGSPTMRHPRGYGSFPRVIRKFVVEDSVLTIEQAVHKMTGLTASIFRLDDSTRVDVPRGRLAVGWAADIVVFDPAEVADRADFTEPHLLAEGMRAVYVAGRPALLNGTRQAGEGSGRVLRADYSEVR